MSGTKYRATAKFQELDITNSYQRLTIEEFFNLKAGKHVELIEVPPHLVEGKYIEKVRNKGVKGDKENGN